MQTISWREYSLSRLMLGTVQFGLPYGVANRIGQPDEEEVRAIVKAAIDGGVNCFDTAAAYGTSEEVLGRVLRHLGVRDRVVVVTKVRALTFEEVADDAQAAQAIEQSVADSRRRLRLNCLPVVLFHREADAVHFGVLSQLRERGWLRYAGVSCDNRPGPAVHFAEQPDVAALQIPANLLDRRHQQSGVFAVAAKQTMAVFIRSAFLQGLLVMPEEDVPPFLQSVIPVRRQFAAVADAAGLSLAALAVRYLLGQEGVTSILTGVETLAQMRENLTLFNQGMLPRDVHAAVDAIRPALPEEVLTPWMWAKLATTEQEACS